MLRESKSVGHSGEVITDGPVHAIAFGKPPELGGQAVRIGDQEFKHFAQGRLRLGSLGQDTRMTIHAFEEKLLQTGLFFGELRRRVDEDWEPGELRRRC